MTNNHVRAIDFFARQYDYGRGPSHARKVAGIATSLFDQFANVGLLAGLTPSHRYALFAAGLVHDLGCTPRARLEAGAPPAWARGNGENGHQWVSFELVRRWLENPPSSAAISPAARSILLHSVLWQAPFNTAAPAAVEPVVDEPVARTLAGVLSIADALDGTLRGRVAGVRAVPAVDWVRILVSSPGSVSDEVAAAKRATGLLESGLCKRIFIQEIVRNN